MATLVRGIAALRALHYAPPKRTASTKIRPSLGALASRFQKPSTRSRIDAASSSIDEADGGPPPEGGEQQEAAATEDGSFADFDIDDRVLVSLRCAAMNTISLKNLR